MFWKTLLLMSFSMTGVAWAGDCPAVLDHQLKALASSEAATSLCEDHGGKVVLVVNTASRCGYTPQLEGLEKLYQQYRSQGLVVLGFPSNDFAQELDNEADIARFCELNYGVQFPMFEKLHVTGEQAHPLFQELSQMSGQAPGWNFHKYLIGRDGQQVLSFPTRVPPESPELIKALESLL